MRAARGRRLLAVLVAAAPMASASAAPTSCLRSPVAVVSPGDRERACQVVRAALPDWQGTAQLATDELPGSVVAETSGNRVLLHLPAWRQLTATGRRVVLAHELVHVATTDVTTAPGWLVEGLAEDVALQGSGLSPRRAAAELATRIGQDPPRHLPDDATIARAEPSTYQEAWLAVELLRRRYGMAAVLDLYRAPDWRSALADLTGRPVAAFEREWAEFVVEQLG